MARSVEQIERDIAALEEVCRALATELDSAYTSYLTELGQAIRQQLILASYHLCTQGYPEHFLSLSFSQREQLQQAICKLGKQASDNLIAYIKTKKTEDRSQELEVRSQNSSPSSSNPMKLAQWQQNLEMAIASTLKTVSSDTNCLLQQAGILPKKLPLSPLLEAAVNSLENSAEATAGSPNLLNLLIETENQDESKDSTVTHIIAIYLRLSEVEFTEVRVRAGRNQIRNLLLQLNKLGQEYHKKQRERAVAEAEAAWRASWFEE